MDEQEAQRLYGEFVELQQQAESLNDHLKQMQEQLAHLEQTKKTIQELQTLEGERETWIPIAPGAYVKGTTKPVDTVLLNIGASIAVEKSPAEVLETLEGHKKVLEELSEAAFEELKGIITRIDSIKEQVDKQATQKETTATHPGEHHEKKHRH